MFAAAMVFSAPKVEVSIYSTCKRISQKLLENIWMFLDMIYTELNVRPYPIIRHNMEQIILQGSEGVQDKRKVNSYPSKVYYPTQNPCKSFRNNPMFNMIVSNVTNACILCLSFDCSILLLKLVASFFASAKIIPNFCFIASPFKPRRLSTLNIFDTHT